MSLNGALQIGRSGILASQAALQVAGNNMANAATEGFHRRSIHLVPRRGEPLLNGQSIGRGVLVNEVRREVDTALQSRLRDAISQEHASLIDQRFLTALETIQNELTENDLSSLLSEFFNSFSELANSPEDDAVRAVVVQQGVSLSSAIATLRNDYNDVLAEVDRSLVAAETQANDLLDRIAEVNQKIATAEGGVGEANALRDQRDSLIGELAELLDVTVIEQPNGVTDVLVGSTPIILAGQSRGVELRRQTVANQLEVTLRVASDGTQLSVSQGRIAGLLRQREGTVQPMIDDLNTFAGQLIFQVNRLHAQGQGRVGFTSVAGTYGVDDTTANLNATAADLPFTIDNGSFFLHVTNTQTGVREQYQINVNGNAMSLQDLVDEINLAVGVPNVTASIGSGNVLQLSAATGYGISFSDDTSGALAALGVNTFFTGRTASDIDVNPIVRNDLDMLAVGAGHVPGSNDTAVAIANLQDQALTALADRSLREFWQQSVNSLAVEASAANGAVESDRLVRESLHAQVQAVSGVSLDEESINLLTYQRQFQAAARFISVIDDVMQALLSIA